MLHVCDIILHVVPLLVCVCIYVYCMYGVCVCVCACVCVCVCIPLVIHGTWLDQTVSEMPVVPSFWLSSFMYVISLRSMMLHN